MISFQVNDMTCGHCAGHITKALKDADPAARVQVDLARHEVAVEGSSLDAQALAAAIADAGYTPQPRLSA